MDGNWQDQRGRVAAINYCVKEIAVYESFSSINHWKWTNYQTVAILFGVIGTITSALPESLLPYGWVRAIPVAIASFATALLASFSYQAEAVRQGSTGDFLEGELAKFVTNAAPYDAESEEANVSLFVNEIRTIISSEQRSWQAQMTAKPAS